MLSSGHPFTKDFSWEKKPWKHKGSLYRLSNPSICSLALGQIIEYFMCWDIGFGNSQIIKYLDSPLEISAFSDV